jgi:hypothetical protein
VAAHRHVPVVRGHDQGGARQVEQRGHLADGCIGQVGGLAVLVRSAAPGVPRLVGEVQLDHDECGTPGTQQLERLRDLLPMPVHVGGERRRLGLLRVQHDMAHVRGEQLLRLRVRGQGGFTTLPPHELEEMLDAQGARVLVRRLAMHLLPGATQHHRTPRQRQRRQADAELQIGAARPQLVQERQPARGLVAEAVHEHQHHLLGERGERRYRRRSRGCDRRRSGRWLGRKRRLVAREGLVRAAREAARV